MAAVKHARAVIKANRKNTNSVRGRAKAMSAGFTNNAALFATPDPTPKELDDQTTTLDAAETKAGTRVKGSASARNSERNKLYALLVRGRTYTQGIADAAPTLDDAVKIIEAAGLFVQIVTVPHKAILTAKQGPEPGTVDLYANATALGAAGHMKTFFNWSYTSDGGKTYIALPSTPKAKTSVANLTPLTTYGFRVSVTFSDATTGAWSQTVTFLVH